jgi:hypothetical protein
MITISIKYTGEVSKRKWDEILKETWYAWAEAWDTRFKMRHFTPEGAKLYNYDPRGAAYMKRKMRVHGHNLPLVWSGASRLLAKRPNIKATSKWGRARINAPGLNLRRAGKQTPMYVEMTRVTVNERRALLAVANKQLERGLRMARKSGAVRRVKIAA